MKNSHKTCNAIHAKWHTTTTVQYVYNTVLIYSFQGQVVKYSFWVGSCQRLENVHLLLSCLALNIKGLDQEWFSLCDVISGMVLLLSIHSLIS